MCIIVAIASFTRKILTELSPVTKRFTKICDICKSLKHVY